MYGAGLRAMEALALAIFEKRPAAIRFGIHLLGNLLRAGTNYSQ